MFRQKLSSLALGFMIGVMALGVGIARAYEQYSLDGDSGNCAECHGNFRAAPYIALTDGQSWESDLMEVHSTSMLAGDCLTCHGAGPRFPVQLGSSAGGDGLDPIGCAGCHGRFEDGTGVGSVGYGAGLRQHHWSAGVEICSGCHDDANPNNFAPVGEDYLPPYYSDADPLHPLIPSNSCNPQAENYPEDYAGSTEGLDNDGDGLYDELDVIDCPEPGLLVGFLPGIGALLMFERRRALRRPRARASRLGDVSLRRAPGKPRGD